MAFQFDTSGTVDAAPGQYISVGDQKYPGVGWGILSPFVRGYVMAMFASMDRHPSGLAVLRRPEDSPCTHVVGFSDLATETLARIMEDCAYLRSCIHSDIADRSETGALVWNDRQAGLWAEAGFPPQTAYLGDDGKAYLREAA